jgi:uncharacterized protein
MGKVLFFVVVAIAIYWWLRRGRMPPKKQAGETRAETMVQCAYCGLHIPVNESVADQGRYYCDEEHLRLGTVKQRG